MGRKSKLTEAQWAEIESRMLNGESRTSLGKEFGIAESSIREKFKGQTDTIKVVANKMADAALALRSLPIPAQITANSLARKLIDISENLASAAMHGSATAHRLNALANSEVSKVDDADPLKSIKQLRNVGVLTKLANESASIGINLLAANKEAIKRMNEPQGDDGPASGVLVVPGVIDNPSAWTQLVQMAPQTKE